MKKVLFEVLLLAVYLAIFFQFHQLRIPLVIGVVAIALWVVPIQLLLSVSTTTVRKVPAGTSLAVFASFLRLFGTTLFSDLDLQFAFCHLYHCFQCNILQLGIRKRPGKFFDLFLK